MKIFLLLAGMNMSENKERRAAQAGIDGEPWGDDSGYGGQRGLVGVGHADGRHLCSPLSAMECSRVLEHSM